MYYDAEKFVKKILSRRSTEVAPRIHGSRLRRRACGAVTPLVYFSGMNVKHLPQHRLLCEFVTYQIEPDAAKGTVRT